MEIELDEKEVVSESIKAVKASNVGKIFNISIAVISIVNLLAIIIGMTLGIIGFIYVWYKAIKEKK